MSMSSPDTSRGRWQPPCREPYCFFHPLKDANSHRCQLKGPEHDISTHTLQFTDVHIMRRLHTHCICCIEKQLLGLQRHPKDACTMCMPHIIIIVWMNHDIRLLFSECFWHTKKGSPDHDFDFFLLFVKKKPQNKQTKKSFIFILVRNFFDKSQKIN